MSNSLQPYLWTTFLWPLDGIFLVSTYVLCLMQPSLAPVSRFAYIASNTAAHRAAGTALCPLWALQIAHEPPIYEAVAHPICPRVFNSRLLVLVKVPLATARM